MAFLRSLTAEEMSMTSKPRKVLDWLFLGLKMPSSSTEMDEFNFQLFILLS